MPNKKPRKLEWSSPSMEDVLVINQYLLKNFSKREIAQFNNFLDSFEKSVTNFPEMFPYFSYRKKLRRAVLDRYLSVYYTIKKDTILIVSVLDNRTDHTKLL